MSNRVKIIDRGYESIQGGLSIFALTFGAVGVGASADFHFLKSEADLSAFGAEFYPVLITVGLSVFLGAMVLKGIGAWVHNKFWLKIELAEKLHGLASRIDPRRSN